MAGSIERIRPQERREGAPTPGMTREEAIATERMWGGLVRTKAGMVSGWHHHGDYETAIFVAAGAVRMEFGPGGGEVLEAGPGDFMHVGAGVVHRESNPTDVESQIVVIRSGSGEPVFNTEGPDPA